MQEGTEKVLELRKGEAPAACSLLPCAGWDAQALLPSFTVLVAGTW